MCVIPCTADGQHYQCLVLKVTGGQDTPPLLKMRVGRGSGGLENPLSHSLSDGGVNCCSKCERGVVVGRKSLCLAFQAREGFVVGMISFHLLKTQEGGS